MRGRKKIGTQCRKLYLANTKSSKGHLWFLELAGALTFSLYFKLAHHYTHPTPHRGERMAGRGKL